MKDFSNKNNFENKCVKINHCECILRIYVNLTGRVTSKFLFSGIKALCDKIEAVSMEVFGNVPLSKEVNVKHLLEKIKSKMENATGCKNFSEYVIPLSRVSII